MNLSYSDFRRFDDKLDRILANQHRILDNQGRIMTALDDLKATIARIVALAQQYLDFIVTKDAVIAARDARIADLVNQHVTDAAEKQALLDAIAAENADALIAENALRAGLPSVPPVGGTALALRYPAPTAHADFDAAIAAYTGAEAVTLDGIEVHAATDLTTVPTDYFTHSATGDIDTVGPTD